MKKYFYFTAVITIKIRVSVMEANNYFRVSISYYNNKKPFKIFELMTYFICPISAMS